MSTELNSDKLESVIGHRRNKINFIRRLIKSTLVISSFLFITRAALVLLMVTNSEDKFKELFFNRLYLGTEKTSILTFYNWHIPNFLFPSALIYIREHLWLGILCLPIIIIIVVLTFIALTPLTYMAMLTTATIDAIMPRFGNIIIWWLVLSIALVVTYLKISKSFVENLLFWGPIVLAIVTYLYISPVNLYLERYPFPHNVINHNIKEPFIFK